MACHDMMVKCSGLVICRVNTGGGTPYRAFQQIWAYPPFFATIIAVALALLDIPLPPTIDLVTYALASANAPLALTAFGATLELVKPQVQQVRPSLCKMHYSRNLDLPYCRGI